jgi:hypothetical protein
MWDARVEPEIVSDMGDRQWFVLYILICLEVGIFLLLVPWSVIWERNYFLQVYPGLRSVFLDPTFRGAVSGLGVANIYIVLHEVMERRRQTALSTTELFPGGLHLLADSENSEDRSGEEKPSVKEGSESRTFATHEKSS